MYYGIPITPDHEVRVNICGRCIDKEEYNRWCKVQETGEGDDYYHFEIHEKEVNLDVSEIE
jgi:hypothetical protein